MLTHKESLYIYTAASACYNFLFKLWNEDNLLPLTLFELKLANTEFYNIFVAFGSFPIIYTVFCYTLRYITVASEFVRAIT